MADRIFALSKQGKKIYERVASVWGDFADQPPLVGEGALLLASPTGQLVVYDNGGITGFRHYTSGGGWTFKAYTPTQSYHWPLRGSVVSDSSIYVALFDESWHEAKIIRYNGVSWGDLVDLASYFPPAHNARIWGFFAASDSNIWVTGYDTVLGFDGAVWTNHAAAIWLVLQAFDPQVIATTIVFPDVWVSPSGNTYVSAILAATDDLIWWYYNAILKWNGVSWSVVGTPTVSDSEYWAEIDGASDDDIWAYYMPAWGQVQIDHWDGAAWAPVYLLDIDISPWAPRVDLPGPTKRLGSISPYAVLAMAKAGATAACETSGGGLWGAVAWPDANLVDAVCCASVPEPYSVTPNPVDMRGGAVLTISGGFTAGQAYRVFMGPLGTISDPPCHGAVPGGGFDCYSADGATLLAVSPPVASGSVADQQITVKNMVTSAVTSFPITITESSWHGSVFSIRRCFPPWAGVGARRLELEERRRLI